MSLIKRSSESLEALLHRDRHADYLGSPTYRIVRLIFFDQIISVKNMAKLGNIKLLDEEYRFTSGIAMPLEQAHKHSHKLEIDNNYEIEVHSENPYVVLRSVDNTGSQSLEFLNETIQKGLDLIAVKCGVYLSTKGKIGEYLIWREERLRHIIRVVETLDLTPGISIKIESPVNLDEDFSRLQPQYQRCLRYIRQALASENSFDAYRYMYLSLENLCGFLEKKSGSEEKWLLRILTSSTLQSIDRLLFREEVIQAIYNVRNRLFHGKDYEDILLPHVKSHTEIVDRTFLDLTQIISVLLKEVLSVELNLSSFSRLPKRGVKIARYVFDSMCETLRGVEFYIHGSASADSSSNNIDCQMEIKSSARMSRTSYIAAFPEGSQNSLLGVLSLNDFSLIEKISDLTLKKPGQDSDSVTMNLRCDLSLDHFDEIEALLILEANLI